ncbi:DUF402 domain-containing protein [Streptomyces sp. NBC_01216]|uniref:DUF402 domain-containing protein n=1 Tax=Streptomyces sp. NBC_01216 TaxID=2903778 RepID=UPI002E0D63CD|nr:DUF402 domain-containing protein [Streptomyces sp. NBC_01216]
MKRFAVGETVVRRDVYRGKVWSAHSLHAVSDTDEALVAGCRPGAHGLGPTSWVESTKSGAKAVRRQAVPDLAAGQWELSSWRWQETAVLLWNPPGTYFSINAFYDPALDHRLLRWYVNFQRPLRRTSIGFDTFDLFLDLIVDPGLSRWTWKDHDEYAHARRLGVVNDDDHRAVDQARDQVLAMVAAREGPFQPEAGWAGWRSDPGWPEAELPPDVQMVDHT